MTVATVQDSIDAGTLLSDYLDHVARLRLSDRAIRDRIRTAREFLARHPDLAAWMALPAVERAGELRSSGAWPLLCYAIGAGRLRLDVELAVIKQLTGLGAAVEMRDSAGFSAMREAGNRLGWSSSWIETVLGECLAVLVACHGGLVADLTEQAIDEFDSALSASSIPRSSRRAYRRGWPACASCSTRSGSSTPLRDDDRGHAASSNVSPTWLWLPRSSTPCCAISGSEPRCCGPNRWNR
ncbi:phage integrase family domain protein [Mycobacterium kansasii 824]|nr:phage integrase family domain protein [Mycobacterium kansasii 824]